eukprot:SM000094S24685  [mRNA]  locus=s94:163593:169096:- [translate_table: standard]
MLESRFFPAPPHPAEGLGVSRHLFDVGDEIFHKQGGHASCEDRCESSRSESVVTGPVDQDVADSASTSGSIEAPSHRRRQEDGRRWLAAVNDRISELIARIQPTRQADVRRANIVEYVRHLTQRCFDCQVFTFGSVPLKTYLPLGDIDLTIFCQIQAVKDIWAYELKRVLDSEMRNPGALYKVTGVVLIEAKVRLIKCCIEGIMVDISFDQLGGLGTLCFLEQVDRLIRRDHLFKQSVILVKAWACYESHIIGANQGLLSTYALEILLLYIFQIYHANLCSPLQVLLHFLNFFGTFDWDTYCLALRGPIPLDALRSSRTEYIVPSANGLLLNEEFLTQCRLLYSTTSSGWYAGGGRDFVVKHMNIMDPLLETNNLGRSVTKGKIIYNFLYIRGAIAAASQKLNSIIQGQDGYVLSSLDSFFSNTWDQNKSARRVDVGPRGEADQGQEELHLFCGQPSVSLPMALRSSTVMPLVQFPAVAMAQFVHPYPVYINRQLEAACRGRGAEVEIGAKSSHVQENGHVVPRPLIAHSVMPCNTKRMSVTGNAFTAVPSVEPSSVDQLGSPLCTAGSQPLAPLHTMADPVVANRSMPLHTQADAGARTLGSSFPPKALSQAVPPNNLLPSLPNQVLHGGFHGPYVTSSVPLLACNGTHNMALMLNSERSGGGHSLLHRVQTNPCSTQKDGRSLGHEEPPVQPESWLQREKVEDNQAWYLVQSTSDILVSNLQELHVNLCMARGYQDMRTIFPRQQMYIQRRRNSSVFFPTRSRASDERGPQWRFDIPRLAHQYGPRSGIIRPKPTPRRPAILETEPPPTSSQADGELDDSLLLCGTSKVLQNGSCVGDFAEQRISQEGDGTPPVFSSENPANEKPPRDMNIGQNMQEGSSSLREVKGTACLQAAVCSRDEQQGGGVNEQVLDVPDGGDMVHLANPQPLSSTRVHTRVEQSGWPANSSRQSLPPTSAAETYQEPNSAAAKPIVLARLNEYQLKEEDFPPLGAQSRSTSHQSSHVRH